MRQLFWPVQAKMLATNLHGNDLISTELLHNVMILSDILNRAVHGEKITGQRAQSSALTV
jgi:hypothetical protein